MTGHVVQQRLRSDSLGESCFMGRRDAKGGERGRIRAALTPVETRHLPLTWEWTHPAQENGWDQTPQAVEEEGPKVLQLVLLQVLPFPKPRELRLGRRGSKGAREERGLRPRGWVSLQPILPPKKRRFSRSLKAAPSVRPSRSRALAALKAEAGPSIRFPSGIEGGASQGKPLDSPAGG